MAKTKKKRVLIYTPEEVVAIISDAVERTGLDGDSSVDDLLGELEEEGTEESAD